MIEIEVGCVWNYQRHDQIPSRVAIAAVDGELPYDDPFGGKHVVSLAPFAGKDPNLFLRIRFVVSREDDELDPDYSDAVVLKEFELPTGTPLPGTDEIA
jgi:hypothetical protein